LPTALPKLRAVARSLAFMQPIVLAVPLLSLISAWAAMLFAFGDVYATACRVLTSASSSSSVLLNRHSDVARAARARRRSQRCGRDDRGAMRFAESARGAGVVAGIAPRTHGRTSCYAREWLVCLRSCCLHCGACRMCLPDPRIPLCHCGIRGILHLKLVIGFFTRA
jgi:hypothetical protein